MACGGEDDGAKVQAKLAGQHCDGDKDCQDGLSCVTNAANYSVCMKDVSFKSIKDFNTNEYCKWSFHAENHEPDAITLSACLYFDDGASSAQVTCDHDGGGILQGCPENSACWYSGSGKIPACKCGSGYYSDEIDGVMVCRSAALDFCQENDGETDGCVTTINDDDTEDVRVVSCANGAVVSSKYCSTRSSNSQSQDKCVKVDGHAKCVSVGLHCEDNNLVQYDINDDGTATVTIFQECGNKVCKGCEPEENCTFDCK